MNDSNSIVRVSETTGRPGLGIITLPLLFLLPACATSTALTSTELVPAPTEELAATPPAESSEPSGVVHLGQKKSVENPVRPAVLTIDDSDPSPGSKIVPLSNQTVIQQPAICPPAPSPYPVFTPAEPRLDPAAARHSMADLYPDEYLVDGGDRKLPVHYFAGERQGFETEDTIAEYKDHFGKSHVRASNRVAVYAPRFGSVQVVEGADAGVQIHQAMGSTDIAGVGSLNHNAGLHQSVTEDGGVAVGSRKRVDGAQTKLGQIQSVQATLAHQQKKVDQSLQARATSSQDMLKRFLGASYQDGLANAAIWSRELYPVLSASTSQATQVKARFTPQDVIGIEDQRAKKSEIHIVKMADKETADAGDTIHFTIRFINTGDYDLHDVQIVDNLTPRLQFIPDSAKTSRAGDVATEPNGEGSLILTFEFDEPLPAHKSGTVEFDVRVQ